MTDQLVSSITLGVLALLTIIPLVSLLWASDIGVRGRWGGFGGGRAGWQVSRGLVLLILTLFFGLSFTAFGVFFSREKVSPDPETRKTLGQALGALQTNNKSCAEIVAAVATSSSARPASDAARQPPAPCPLPETSRK